MESAPLPTAFYESIDANVSYDSNATDHHLIRRHMVKGVDLNAAVKIVLYSIIFILSIAGNTLVIVTLVQNKRMRTVTNVFLLNLSVSDLLLAIFCMPFTLTGHLLQNWIFGSVMCTLILYFQGKLDMIVNWMFFRLYFKNVSQFYL